MTGSDCWSLLWVIGLLTRLHTHLLSYSFTHSLIHSDLLTHLLITCLFVWLTSSQFTHWYGMWTIEWDIKVAYWTFIWREIICDGTLLNYSTHALTHSRTHQDVYGSGNNFAHGHYFYGPKYRDSFEEGLRNNAEKCDSLQTFIVTHSLGGGTGSGVGIYTTHSFIH